jgi:prepilin-type N-terminal cleavage/methylation domain-containing protein
MKKPAFTMLELVFVIVVLGILAATSIPRMERDIKQEAADNILSAIRYTQHMALMDNVETPGKNKWQRKYWRFGVASCGSASGLFYYVGSDKDLGGGLGNTEAAVDPTNGKIMLGSKLTSCADGVNNNASPDIFLSHKYGIKDTNIFSSCPGAGSGAGRYIGFDYMGRPHTGFSAANLVGAGGAWDAPIASDCNLTFQFENTNVTDLVITIEKETGRAYVAD